MGEWFEDWFSSEEYFSVYRHRDENDAEILTQLITRTFSLQPNSRILDIACGTGRHAISFAQKGFRVTGIDLNSKILEIAVKNSREKNLIIDFLNADMRNFSLENKFDLVCSLFTSFGFFERDEENFSILENAYDHLNKGSYFVLDYLNSVYLKTNIIPISIENYNEKEILQKRFIEGKRIYKEIVIKKNGACKSYWESVRLYSLQEIQKKLEVIGFTIKYVFGDYRGNNYIDDKSSRLIIFAVK